ncbi:hypothetical protein ABZP36_012528 [Zizania latifolia]
MDTAAAEAELDRLGNKKKKKGSRRARLRAVISTALRELHLASSGRGGDGGEGGAVVAAPPGALLGAATDADTHPPVAMSGRRRRSWALAVALVLVLACVVALGRGPAICCCTCAAWWCGGRGEERPAVDPACHRRRPPCQCTAARW